VLFEVARGETEVSALRTELGLDAGYLSRILARFEEAGVMLRERSPSDARRQVVRAPRRWPSSAACWSSLLRAGRAWAAGWWSAACSSREAGYREMVLWTNDVLVDARRLYERAGFSLREQGQHRAFGADLVEQTWGLHLQ
jgi:hypothetical protein